MMKTTRIQELRQKFNDYSDIVHRLVFCTRGGLVGNMQYDELIEMKKGLVMDLDEMMSANQEYMYLLGESNSHPNYEKFVAYVKIAKAELDREIAKKA